MHHDATTCGTGQATQEESKPHNGKTTRIPVETSVPPYSLSMYRALVSATIHKPKHNKHSTDADNSIIVFFFGVLATVVVQVKKIRSTPKQYFR